MAVGQVPKNYMKYVAPEGWEIELPSFTCMHCNRMVAPSPRPEKRQTKDDVETAIKGWLEAANRAPCHACDGLVCGACRAAQQLNPARGCYSILRDAERALVPTNTQPYMLRGLEPDGSDAGEPVRRLFIDGQARLVLKKHLGYSDEALERMSQW